MCSIIEVGPEFSDCFLMQKLEIHKYLKQKGDKKANKLPKSILAHTDMIEWIHTNIIENYFTYL
jgi:hypothetical protein